MSSQTAFLFLDKSYYFLFVILSAAKNLLKATINNAGPLCISKKILRPSEWQGSLARRPDRKPGRELALRAEGFFCLEFLVLLFQDKTTSPRGNEQDRIIPITKVSFNPTRSNKPCPIFCHPVTVILTFSAEVKFHSYSFHEYSLPNAYWHKHW